MSSTPTVMTMVTTQTVGDATESPSMAFIYRDLLRIAVVVGPRAGTDDFCLRRSLPLEDGPAPFIEPAEPGGDRGPCRTDDSAAEEYSPPSPSSSHARRRRRESVRLTGSGPAEGDAELGELASPPSSAVSTQAPVGVSVNVCSKWAAQLPSAVTTVQSSSRTRLSLPPSVTIGSTASARPCDQLGPAAGTAEVGHVRRLVHLGADAVPDVVLEDAVAALGPRTWVSTACEMSVTRPPRRAAAIPRHIASSVTAHQLGHLGGHVADGTVIAASPCQPSTIAPQSMEMTSPSASPRSPGMPCTTSSLTEAQIEPGKPW